LVVNVFLLRDSERISQLLFSSLALVFQGLFRFPVRRERGPTAKAPLRREAQEDKIHLGLCWLSNRSNVS
jgi:hypothetical protein